MSEISIESIEALAKNVDVEDGILRATFQPPSGGEEVHSAAPIHPPQEPEAGEKEPFYFSLARSANSLVRDILGYNAAFDAATTAVDSALDDADKAEASEAERAAKMVSDVSELSDDERQDALYRAFMYVMHRFAWDPANDEWVVVHDARGLGSELQRQLKLAPVESKSDRDILERMLVEVATADDELDRAEEELLLGFVDRSKITQGAHITRWRVSQNDLRQTTTGASRETLYMLAAATALADHKFDLKESDRLEFYAKGLNIEDHRAEELLEAAQMFFIEQYMVRRFSERGELDEQARDEVRELAVKIGYDPDSAELAFERYQRVKDSGGGFSSGLSW